MKRSLLLGLLFLLAIQLKVYAQPNTLGCGLGTTVELRKGSPVTGECAEDPDNNLLEFRAVPFYSTYVIVVTDDDLNILAVTRNRRIDFRSLPGGQYRVYGLFYNGLLLVEPGMNANSDELATICYGFTDNYITIDVIKPTGGIVSTAAGSEEAAICLNDPVSGQTIDFATTSVDTSYRYLVTDTNNKVLAIEEESTINFSTYTDPEFRVYGLSFLGALFIELGDTLDLEEDLATDCFELSENFVRVVKESPEGGTLSFLSGGTSTFACEGDFNTFDLVNEGASDDNYAYVITSRNGIVLGLSTESSVDFTDLTPSKYRIYGIAYTGELRLENGVDIMMANVSTKCHDLSDNFLSVTIPNLNSEDFSLTDGALSATICRDGVSSSTLSFTDKNTSAQNKVYFLANPDKEIIGIEISPTINFNIFDEEEIHVYCLAFTGTLLTQVGDTLGDIIYSNECYELSSNFVSVHQDFLGTGTISLTEGASEVNLCLDQDYGNTYNFDLGNLDGDHQAIILTDNAGTVLELSDTPSITLSEDFPESFRVYGLTYTGELIPNLGAAIESATFASDCYLLSTNFVRFESQRVAGGTVTLDDGATAIEICVQDADADLLTFDAIGGAIGVDYRFVLVNEQEEIILALTGNAIDFNVTNPGVTKVYGVSYSGNWQAQNGDPFFEMMLSDACFEISENAVEVTQLLIEGGRVRFENGDSTAIVCKLGQADILAFANENTSGPSYDYYITDQENRILASVENESSYNFDQLDFDTLRVWGLAYNGNRPAEIALNQSISEVALSDECYDLSDNYLTVIKTVPEPGQLAFQEGGDFASFCSQELERMVAYEVEGESLGNYIYLITDRFNILQDFTVEDSYNFAAYDLGVYKIWGLVYTGNLNLNAGDHIQLDALSDDCFFLSENSLEVVVDELDGGSVGLSNGTNELFICEELDDVFISMKDVISTGDEYTYFFVDTENTIIGFTTSSTISLRSVGVDEFRVFGLTYSGELLIQEGDRFSADMVFSSECYDLSENDVHIAITITNGGELSFTDGTANAIIDCTRPELDLPIVADNISDDAYAFILTDLQDRILGAQEGQSFDFSNFENGEYKVWGVSFSGNLSASTGSDISSATLSTGCFDLSRNALNVTKELAKAGAIVSGNGASMEAVCAASLNQDLSFMAQGVVSGNYRYLVATLAGEIRAIEEGNSFDVDFGNFDTILVYGLAFTGDLTAAVGMQLSDIGSSKCFEITDNAVMLLKTEPIGGDLLLSSGEEVLTLCPEDDSNLSFSVSGNSQTESFFLLVTNEDNEFIRAILGTEVDLNIFPAGVYHIWGLSAFGQIIVQEGDDVTNSQITPACFDLSNNFVDVRRLDPIGGQVSTIDGKTTLYACPGNGNSKLEEFETTNVGNTGSLAYILTDAQEQIIDVLDIPQLDLDTLEKGAYKVFSLTYNGELMVQSGADIRAATLASSCFQLSENVVDIILDDPIGGSISANSIDGNKICINSIDTEVRFDRSNESTSTAYTYLVTNDLNQYLFEVEESVDLNFLFQGDLKVWGLAYTGNLIIEQFDNVLETVLTDDCFSLSDNNLTIVREDIDGGNISLLNGLSSAFACPGDDVEDLVELMNNSVSPAADYVYIITTENNEIFTALEGNSRDFDNIGAFRTLRIWGLSYTGNLNVPIFENLFETQLSDGCFDISNNFVTIYRDEPEATEINTSEGNDLITLCPGASSDTLYLMNASSSLAAFAYILVDNSNQQIASINTTAQLLIQDLPIGEYTLYGLSYTGQLLIAPGDTFDIGATLSDNCFELALNEIQVVRGGEVFGGMLSTPTGETTLYTCPFDGMGDLIFVNAPEAIPGTDYRIVITGVDNKILFPDIEGGIIPFDGAAPGEYRVWGISFTGEYRGQFDLNILEDPLSTDCYTTSDNFITVISVAPNAGQVSTTDNRDTINIGPDDEEEIIQLENNSVSNAPYRYLLTDTNNIILGILDGDQLSTDTLAEGNYYIYGVDNAGTFGGMVGLNILEDPLADNCYSVSSNAIVLNIDRTSNTLTGKATTLKASVAKVPENKIFHFGLYPNPAKHYVNVRFNWEFAREELNLNIYNASGQLLIQKRMLADQGDNQLELDLTSLKKGVYLLSLNGKTKASRQRFIKL